MSQRAIKGINNNKDKIRQEAARTAQGIVHTNKQTQEQHNKTKQETRMIFW